MKMSERLNEFLKKNASATDEVENSGAPPADNSDSNNKSSANPIHDGACRACKIPDEFAVKPSIFVLARVAIAVIILVVGHFLKEPAAVVTLGLQLLAFAVVGYDLVLKAMSDIQNGSYLRESTPVLIAVILSFTIGREVEGIVATILLQLTFILRDYAYCRVRSSINNDASSPEALENLRTGGEKVTDFEAKMFKFSSIFAAAMLIIGIIVIITLPVFKLSSFAEAIRRAVAIIVIASPCGALISIPISLFASMSASERLGFRFKSAKALDDCGSVAALAFEKVGTITSFDFKVTSIDTDKMDPLTFLKVAAHSASVGTGPVYRAIIAAYDLPISPNLVQKFFETPGKGVSVLVDNIEILLGTAQFLSENSVTLNDQNHEFAVYMTLNGQFAGSISFGDSVNPEIRDTLAALSDCKIDRISMLSGAGREKDRAVAADLHISEYFSECGEHDREKHLAQMKTRVDAKRKLAYVAGGRGYENALSAADVGIILGSENDCAAADVLILNTDVSEVPKVYSFAQRARRFIVISMLVALGAKLILTVLAGFGLVPIWFTLLMDTCVSLELIVYCLNKQRFEPPKKPEQATETD